MVANLKKSPQLAWGIFALVAFVIAWYFGSRTGKTVTNSELTKEIKKNDLTYDLSQYSAFADRLKSAMFRLNDDEDAIYAVFAKMRNKSDVLQLIKSFGSQRIILTIGSANLNEWITNNLTGSEIEKINEILDRNNIDYKF